MVRTGLWIITVLIIASSPVLAQQAAGADDKPAGAVSGSNEFGLGDSIFRLFYKPGSLEWEMPCTWGPRKGETLKWSLIPLLETTVPTNTDDILGNDTWVLSPGFAIAGDTSTSSNEAGRQTPSCN